MAECFIMRRGGGGSVSNAFAVIAVTYPEGSICTCSNGTKTLRANDTGGAWLFLLPEAGMWTVSCTDGVQTANKNVNITHQYQAENVTLSYELVIVRDGISTVEWTTDGKSMEVLEPVDGCYPIKWICQPGGSGRIDRYISTPAIDFTDYSTLFVKLHWTDQTGSSYRSLLFGPTQYSTANAIVVHPEGTENAFDIDTAVDISKISGMQYIELFRSQWSNTSWTKVDITHIYLR